MDGGWYREPVSFGRVGRTKRAHLMPGLTTLSRRRVKVVGLSESDNSVITTSIYGCVELPLYITRKHRMRLASCTIPDAQVDA